MAGFFAGHYVKEIGVCGCHTAEVHKMCSQGTAQEAPLLFTRVLHFLCISCIHCMEFTALSQDADADPESAVPVAESTHDVVVLLRRGEPSSEDEPNSSSTTKAAYANAVENALVIPIGFKKAIFFIGAVQVLTIVWLLSLSLQGNHSTLNTGQSFSNTGSSQLAISTNAEGEKYLDVSAIGLRFLAPSTFYNKQIVSQGLRTWDSPIMVVYVGDTVVWTWHARENLVSCDENSEIVSKPVLHSGKLQSDSKYSYRFTKSGTYRYTSENSQTMTGTVKVLDIPSLTTPRAKTGRIKPIKSGVLLNVPFTDVTDIDGCWEECVNVDYSNTVSKSMIESCSGDWIFMGSAAQQGGSTYSIGAFARKATVLSSIFTSNMYGDFTFSPLHENGAYWYYASFTNYGYQTFGFAEGSPVTLNPSYIVQYGGSCQNSLSWSLVNYFQSKDCNTGIVNRKVILTNKCPTYYF